MYPFSIGVMLDSFRTDVNTALDKAQALGAQPDNGHLRRQSGKLYQTQISTIHAFCTVLLRQWGHLLDVPADFALCEEEEAQVLMDRTLNQVLEARYEEVDPEGNFARLLDILSAGRDDSRLAALVLDAPVTIVCLCIQTENVCKMPLGVLRLRSRKWINDITREGAAA